MRGGKSGACGGNLFDENRQPTGSFSRIFPSYGWEIASIAYLSPFVFPYQICYYFMPIGKLCIKIIQNLMETIGGNHSISNTIIGVNIRNRAFILIIGISVLAVNIVNKLSDFQITGI